MPFSPSSILAFSHPQHPDPEFTLEIVETLVDSVKLLVTETGGSGVSGILTSLIEAQTLPGEFSGILDAIYANATYVSAYKISVLNAESGVTQELGYASPGVDFETSSTPQTTTTQHYVAEQMLVTIGQLLSTMTPITISESGQSIHLNLPKFYHPKSIKDRTLPSMSQAANSFSLVHQVWPGQVWAQSYTGKCAVSSATRSVGGSLTITDFEASYDETRRCNWIVFLWEWDQDFADSMMGPCYFVITATYGGVTSIVALEAAYYIPIVKICEKTLGGALGTTTYTLHCIQRDGTIIDNLATAEINHVDDYRSQLIFNRGM